MVSNQEQTQEISTENHLPSSAYNSNINKSLNIDIKHVNTNLTNININHNTNNNTKPLSNINITTKAAQQEERKSEEREGKAGKIIPKGMSVQGNVVEEDAKRNNVNNTANTANTANSDNNQNPAFILSYLNQIQATFPTPQGFIEYWKLQQFWYYQYQTILAYHHNKKKAQESNKHAKTEVNSFDFNTEPEHPFFYINHKEEIRTMNIINWIEALFTFDNLNIDYILRQRLDNEGYISIDALVKHPQLVLFKIGRNELFKILLEHRQNPITETVETFDTILVRNRDLNVLGSKLWSIPEVYKKATMIMNKRYNWFKEKLETMLHWLYRQMKYAGYRTQNMKYKRRKNY